jgi:serine/threonine protein kinase
MDLVTGGLNSYTIYIFIEGELFDKIINLGSYSERDASLVMLALFRTVKYMHDQGIAHRDLKVIYLSI